MASAPTSATTSEPKSFEFSGQFAGIFRDVFGKRRLTLRVKGGELYLKVPKALRRELADKLQVGQEILVTGYEAEEDDRVGLIASSVRLAGRALPPSGVVRVCAKKNCWQSGGKEFWRTLEGRISAEGLSESVKLKATGCLDRCKHAPNADCGSREFRHCNAETVDEILSEFSVRV